MWNHYSDADANILIEKGQDIFLYLFSWQY